MRKKLKEIPKFKGEDEEREFWWSHDSTDYLDWDKAELVEFPNLKRTVRSVLPHDCGHQNSSDETTN